MAGLLFAWAVTVNGAAPPLYDPFNYPAGASLPGQTNPDGNTWAAAGPTGQPPTVNPAGSLSYPGLLPSIGNSVHIQAGTGPSARFPLGVTHTNGPIYFSFIFQPRELAGLGTGGSFFAGFNNSAGAQGTTPTVVGTRVLLRAAQGGFNVGLSKASSAGADFVWDPRTFIAGDSIFVVGCYTAAPDGTANDTAHLWINPPPSSLGATSPPPGGLSSTAGNDLNIASFVFFVRGFNLQPNINIADELRLGTNWASVTPTHATTVRVDPGFTAIGNNYHRGANTLKEVLPAVAEGSVFYKFDSAANAYTINNFVFGDWERPEETFAPGEGAWFYSEVTQPLSFAGDIAPLASRPRLSSGYYLASCRAPAPANFQDLMGFVPEIGDRVYKYEQTLPEIPEPEENPTSVHTFGPNGWDLEPLLFPGKAALVVLTQPPCGLLARCPADIEAQAASLAGAVINYGDPITPTNCGPQQIRCAPPSGSAFPVGTTTVTCDVTNPRSGETARCSFNVTVRPRAAEVFFPELLLPPPLGMYIHPRQFSQRYSNSLLIRDVRLRTFTGGSPPPDPEGEPQEHVFGADVELDYSLDGGMTWDTARARASARVRVAPSQFTGGTRAQIFDTELLQLDVRGGSLPPGVVIRESPTHASLGGITVRQVTGGYMISSFFDIWTEIFDGETWVPADAAAPLELRQDPVTVPFVASPSALLPPPNDLYVTAAGAEAVYAQDVAIKDVRYHFFRPSSLPPPRGGTELRHFSAIIDMQVAMAGQPFRHVRALADTGLLLRNAGQIGQEQLLDAEIVQLDVHGGDLPPDVILRESPTRPSVGGTQLRQLSDGTFAISSFFDVFTELSVDGGQNWIPSDPPARLLLVCNALETLQASADLPPEPGRYIALSDTAYQEGTFWLKEVRLEDWSSSMPPPPPGSSQIQSFSAELRFLLCVEGQPCRPVKTAANLVVSVASTADEGQTRYFDTELLRLELVGGSSPDNVRLRESASRPSLGRVSIRGNAAGGPGYYISSFFDVFTELSGDGGQTWSPSSGPTELVLIRPRPCSLFCPPDLTVFADGPGGTLVTYPAPYGDTNCGPITVVCHPPSGSNFPVGVTTVTCQTTNLEVQDAACTFEVTVRRTRILFDGLAHTAFGNAMLEATAEGRLRLSNLGSEGTDGMLIEAGEADAILAVFEPTDILKNNTCIVTTARSPLAIPLSVANLLGAGNSPFVSADFSGLDSAVSHVQVRDERGRVLESYLANNNGPVQLHPLFPCRGEMFLYSWSQGADFVWWRFCQLKKECDPPAGTNQTAGYFERTVCIRAILPPGAVPPAIATVDLVSQGEVVPTSLTFRQEKIQVFGNMHHASGQAQYSYEAARRRLIVHNIGASGEDGVEIQVGATSALLPPEANPLEGYASEILIGLHPLALPGNANSSLRLTAIGSYDNDPRRALGHCRLTYESENNLLRVQADFSSLGGSVVRAEMHEGGQLVGHATIPAGDVGTLAGDGHITGCGKLAPRPLPCFWIGFSARMTLRASDGSQLTGTELRLLSADAPGQANGVSSFGIRAANVESFVIHGELTPRVTEVQLDSNRLPPPEGMYMTFPGEEQAYANGVVIRNVRLRQFSESQPPPEPGRGQDQTLTAQVELEHSQDDGATFQPATGVGSLTIRLTNPNGPNQSDRPLEAQIVQMEIRGGTLPAGIVIGIAPQARNSSVGHTTVRSVPSGYRIDSFFDVFTELSLDGGQQWIPSVGGASRVRLVRDCNVTLACPPDIKAWTCHPDGMKIEFGPEVATSCEAGVTVTCLPPSGSNFPVGDTPVTCTARDSNGVTATCRFVVTVVLDNDDPRLSCPPRMTVWTCSPNGLVIDYPTPVATDDCDTNATVTCTPPSGAMFPPGNHTVTCRAVDDCQNGEECAFLVTVVLDAEPPRLACPQDIRLWTCSPNGTNVSYTVSANDDSDTNVTVRCTPPPGHFNPGITTVTCTATDDCGRTAECGFQVEVRVDRAGPELRCPDERTLWMCSPHGTNIHYTVGIVDDCDTNPTLVCTPPSGANFLPGTTLVNCRAVDDCGNTTECRFAVRVVHDTNAPTLFCPSNQVVRTCLERDIVRYSAWARDDCDLAVDVSCQPPSGSAFPVGVTTVNCTATDDCGNKSECRFSITMQPEPRPPLSIAHLPGGAVRLCWPYPSTGYRLQCARSLNNPIQWIEITNEPVVIGGMRCVVLPHPGPHQFYRLCCANAPFVSSVSSTAIRQGDVLTVLGSGFGNNPDNLCVVWVPAPFPGAGSPGSAAGQGVIPLRVLHAQDDFLTARVGIISPRDPASGLPNGRIMVGLGQGTAGRFRPAFFDVFVADDVWTWKKDGGPAALGEQEIVGHPTEPPPDTVWYQSGPPTEDGALCVFIQGDWPSNAWVSVTARAHDSVSGTGGYDLDAPLVIFAGGGTLRDCVERIADVIRCAFLQQAGVTVEVDFAETPPGSGVYKLTVRIPGGHIDRGMLAICVQPPPVQPEVGEVSPASATTGEIVTVRGSNFPPEPDDICLVAVNGTQWIPFRVLHVEPDGTLLRARLGPVPLRLSTDTPLPIMIGVGKGEVGRFRPAFLDVFVADDVWTWKKQGPAGVGQPNFVPRRTVPPATAWLHNEPITDGAICVTLPANVPWPNPATVSVTARAHDSVTGAGGHDLDAPTVRLLGGGSTLDCAERIADILRCAFLQQAGVNITVDVTVLPNGDVQICVRIPGGMIDRGMLTICVRPG